MFPPNVEPTYTPNLHLELFSPLGVGWREDATAGALLDENMLLIDAAVASGGSVTSVNGQTGVVVLTAAEVGADASGAAAAAQSNAEANAATLYIPLSVLTAHGDIIYEDASLGPISLPIGSTGYLMTVAGGQPAWEAVPTWNQSTTGTAAGLSGTPALPSGTTAATVSNSSDASASVASDAFVQNAIELSMSTVPLNLGSQGPATYSFACLGTGSKVNFTASGGAITSITIWIPFVGSGYKAGDLVGVAGGNNDAILAISAVGGAGYPTSGVILYGGTGYTSGTDTDTPALSSIPFTFLFSGALSGNIEFLMTPGTYQTQSNQWIFCNNCTGDYTITIAVSNSTNTGAAGGRTVVLPQGTNNSSSTFVQTDGELNVDLVAPSALPNGTTAATQTAGDNSTKIATDAFVATAVGAYLPLSVLTTEGDMLYENASLGKMRLPIGATGQVLTVASGLPSWANAPATTLYPSSGIILFDDFVGGVSGGGTGTIGALGWSSGTSGSGAALGTTITAGAFGSVKLTSGTTSSTGYAACYLVSAGTYLGFNFSTAVFDMRWRASLSSASSITFMGMTENNGPESGATDEIGIAFINGTDTYWSLVTKKASSSRNAVPIGTNAPDTNFHTFRLRGDGTGTIYASIDYGTEVSTSTSVPTTTSLVISAINVSTGSSTNTVVDYFWLGLTIAR